MGAHYPCQLYLREWADLDRQIQALNTDSCPKAIPNLERAAQLINDLPAFWSHDGVTNKQREALVQEVFY